MTYGLYVGADARPSNSSTKRTRSPDVSPTPSTQPRAQPCARLDFVWWQWHVIACSYRITPRAPPGQLHSYLSQPCHAQSNRSWTLISPDLPRLRWSLIYLRMPRFQHIPRYQGDNVDFPSMGSPFCSATQGLGLHISASRAVHVTCSGLNYAVGLSLELHPHDIAQGKCFPKERWRRSPILVCQRLRSAKFALEQSGLRDLRVNAANDLAHVDAELSLPCPRCWHIAVV